MTNDPLIEGEQSPSVPVTPPQGQPQYAPPPTPCSPSSQPAVPQSQPPEPATSKKNYIPDSSYPDDPASAPRASTPPQPGAVQPGPAQPGAYQSPQYGPPPGAGYGYGLPLYAQTPDGNTSGMGAEYPAPPEASGWTFAGFVPFGIFAFVMGNVMWGVIGLVVCIIPVLNYIAPLVYGIYVGLNGKKLAWQGKRFDSMEQYAQTMRAWNMAGVALFAIITAFLVLVSILGLMIGRLI